MLSFLFTDRELSAQSGLKQKKRLLNLQLASSLDSRDHQSSILWSHSLDGYVSESESDQALPDHLLRHHPRAKENQYGRRLFPDLFQCWTVYVVVHLRQDKPKRLNRQ